MLQLDSHIHRGRPKAVIGPRLEVAGVSKIFKSQNSGIRRLVAAVDGVSLTIAPGKSWGIVGESGAGKTTLGKMMLGLMRPSSGAITLDGTSVSEMRRKAPDVMRKKIRFVFQSPESALNPAMTLKEVLEESLRREGVGRGSEMREALSSVLQTAQLSSRQLSRLPSELSGGEKRRAALARVLVGRPAIIVADEPVCGLDVSLQRFFIQAFNEAVAIGGASVVCISHNLFLVSEVCTMIAAMYRGRLVEKGEARTVFRGGAMHPYTRELAASFSLEGERDANSLGSLSRADKGCNYAASCEVFRQRGNPEVCLVRRPELTSCGRDHAVACHYAGSD